MQLRLASYNIQKAVGVDLRRDPARVLHVLNQIRADVVVLQEADKRLAPRPSALPRFLIEQDTDYLAADIAENDVSLGWHGNAVLIRRGLRIEDTGRIPLPGLEPRGAVYVRVSDNGGAPITVIGTHFGLLRSWRRRQARALSDHVRRLESDRTAILGDFNEWSLSKGLGPLSSHFRILSPGRTFHAARPVAPLDRVLLAEGLTLLDMGVEHAGRARVASDHLPIWVDVT